MATASAADFSTVLEWSWTSSTTLPDYLNIMNTYHITNVLPDRTIPTEESPNWLATSPHLNNFRLNQYGPGEGPMSVPEPSSILSLLALGTIGATFTLKRKLKSSNDGDRYLNRVG
ncbi:PEP-CTERM sorting domain-containing protein [Microcystis aeruginosa]|uniref:PEP-CTERM sorting domain-containing protein n=1 Tax=Microcystis aeruginosa TaxID=1126 RepID=UPI00264972EB